jgi:hypothetical protein
MKQVIFLSVVHQATSKHFTEAYIQIGFKESYLPIRVIRGVPMSFAGSCGWIAFSQRFIVTPHWKHKLASAAEMMPRRRW